MKKHSSGEQIVLGEVLGTDAVCVVVRYEGMDLSQVLAEAGRTRRKHLMTVEPAISVAQTGEMRSRQLQLVVPAPLLGSFTSSQRNWLMTLEGFIGLVGRRQRMGS